MAASAKALDERAERRYDPCESDEKLNQARCAANTRRLVRAVHEAQTECYPDGESRANDRDDSNGPPVRRLHPDLGEPVESTEIHARSV